ncbi:hypothetical protein CRYUN_Cryun05aG0198400 [Craigia yunnanensis]
MGSFHIAQRQNPRLYRTKRSVVTENCDGKEDARIPRATLKEAQAALFEYLHFTRNIQFMDAENMSKNSPHFLRKLLKRVKNLKDVGRVLCAFGIERNKIGQIYKKAVQVFQHEYGVLPLKLLAYQELGLSQSFMAKIIVCSPRALIGNVDMKFIKVLDILKSVGFDYAWIKEHLSEQDSYNWSMILRVLNIFSEVGCSCELHGLISQHPGLLFGGSGDGALSLIAFLLKFGLPVDQISSMFLQVPEIQVGQFVSNLIKCFLFLHEIEMEVDEIGKIVFLPHITWFMQENPQELGKWGIRTRVGPLPRDAESQRLKMKFFLDLGYGENPTMMKKAHKAFRGWGGELQERFDSIVNAGLDKEDVSEMVTSSPQILNQRKAVIQSKIDILVN